MHEINLEKFYTSKNKYDEKWNYEILRNVNVLILKSNKWQPPNIYNKVQTIKNYKWIHYGIKHY